MRVPSAPPREWLTKTAVERRVDAAQNTNWFERNIFPVIGAVPIADLKPRDVLAALQKIEARGAVESAHKIKQLCRQVFRYAVAADLAERDVTSGSRNALSAVPEAHLPAITEPKQIAARLRSIDVYQGHPFAATALRGRRNARYQPRRRLRPGRAEGPDPMRALRRRCIWFNRQDVQAHLEACRHTQVPTCRQSAVRLSAAGGQAGGIGPAELLRADGDQAEAEALMRAPRSRRLGMHLTAQGN